MFSNTHIRNTSNDITTTTSTFSRKKTNIEHEYNNTSYTFMTVSSNIGIKYSIYDQSRMDYMTYEGFLIQLETNQEFRQIFTFYLLKHDYSSFFWECVPVSYNILKSTSFHCVIIPTLFNNSPDIQSFSNHFQNASRDDLVISFKNLRGDSDLVVPCPYLQNNLKHYIHLASFLRNGNPQQIDELWKKTAQVMKHRLSESEDDLVWLSTHGKGINWLHIRIDSEPKYYQYQEFKLINS